VAGERPRAPAATARAPTDCKKSEIKDAHWRADWWTDVLRKAHPGPRGFAFALPAATNSD